MISLLWRWGPAVAWAGLIFVLSAQPGLRISSDDNVDAPARHVAHGFVYTVLVLLIIHGMGQLGRPLTVRTAVIAGVLGVGYGITDEVHQTFVPDRTGQAIDVGYDAVGVGVGLIIAWAWGRLRPRIGNAGGQR